MLKKSNRRIWAVCVTIAWAALALLLGSRQAEAQVTVESVIGTAVSNSNDAQYQDVADALTRFQNGDVSAARELLVRAKEKNPKLTPAEVMLARLLIASGQLAPARAELERAVHRLPQRSGSIPAVRRIGSARRTNDRRRSFVFKGQDAFRQFQGKRETPTEFPDPRRRRPNWRS